MHRLSVGEKYPGIGALGEGAAWHWTTSGHTLLVCYDQPTADEIEQVRTGGIELGVCSPRPQVVYLLARCGTLPWLEAPYCCHLERREVWPEMPELGPESRALVTVALVDRSRTIHVLRALSATPAWTRRLYDLLAKHRQSDTISPALYDVLLRHLEQQHKTTDLVQFARGTGGHCVGGA